MEEPDFWSNKSFADMPSWYKQLETIIRPSLENQLNEMRCHERRIRQMSREFQVRNKGIELAIERYGLRRPSEDNEPSPSTSKTTEPQPKRIKVEENQEDFMSDMLRSAIRYAIVEKGLKTKRSR